MGFTINKFLYSERFLSEQVLLKNLVLAEDGLQYPHLIPAPPPLLSGKSMILGLDVLVRLTPLVKQGSKPRRGGTN